MTNITMDGLNRGWNFGFVTDAALAFRKALKERSRRGREFRTTEADLRPNSRDEISELGISRADCHPPRRMALPRLPWPQVKEIHGIAYELSGRGAPFTHHVSIMPPSGVDIRHITNEATQYDREDEFRSALDSYVTDYRTHLAGTIGEVGCGSRDTHPLGRRP